MSKILALDFETSGLDPKRHAPVSLGLALMDGEEVIDSREWLIGPKRHYKTGTIEREYDVAALQVSRASWKSIMDAPSPSEVCRELATTIGEWDAAWLPVVAFNAPFDLAFYSELLFMAGGYDRAAGIFLPFFSPMVGGWVCARMLAGMKVRGLADYKLDTVSAYFELSRTSEKHGALEDAILAGRVYSRLTQRVEAAS